jgi:tight adherence protein B
MAGLIGALVGAAVLLLLASLLIPARRAGRTGSSSRHRLTERQQNLLIAVGGAVVILCGVRILIGSWVIAVLFSSGGVALPGWLNHVRLRRRNEQIVEQLEGLMHRLASAMAGSGLTAEMAWVEAAAEFKDKPPLGPELAIIVQELQVAHLLSDILRNRGRHLGIDEFELIATSTSVMGALGGNLAERYRRAGEMLAMRRTSRATMQSLTQESRMSVNVIAAIPFGVFGLFRWSAPEFLDPLLSSALGLTIVAVAMGIIVGGCLIAHRMIRTEE